MKSLLSLICVALMTGLLSGCDKGGSGSQNPQDKTSTAPDLGKTGDLFSTGGQPGHIQISGVLISASSSLDSRISLTIHAGKSKSGEEAAIDSDHKPLLSSKVAGPLDLTKNQDRFVALDCDGATVRSYVKKGLTELTDAIKGSDGQILYLSADTIVLCGKMQNIQPMMASMTAKTIVLWNVDFGSSATLKKIELNAQNLVLVGNNSIHTRGDIVFISAADIFLNITEKFSPENGAHLDLISEGADYKSSSVK